MTDWTSGNEAIFLFNLRIEHRDTADQTTIGATYNMKRQGLSGRGERWATTDAKRGSEGK